MPTLTQDQLVKMVDDVATIRTLTGTHNERLEKVESSVTNLSEKLNGHGEWKDGVNGKLDELKVSIDKCGTGRVSLLDLDKATMIKLLALLVAAILAGSAGGQGVIDLVKLILSIGG